MNATTLLAQGLINLDHAGLGHRNQTLARLREVGVPEGVVLAAVKAILKQRVDVEAEERRIAVITPGAGQAAEYMEAQSQAAAALKAPSSATAEKYPMLAASIGIDLDPSTGAASTDILGVARSVQAASQLWVQYGSAIRGERLGVKSRIEAAEDVAAACAAYDGRTWPSAF